MQALQRTSGLIVISLALATACVLPNVTITDPVAQATLQALTVDAAVLGTQQAADSISTAQPPTEAMTPTDVPSPTATLTAPPSPTATLSPTPVVIASPTPVVPLIHVTVPTNCRSGPGKDYRIEGALLVDESAQILARDPTGHYWQIPNPDSPGDFCWVWDGYAVISGFVGAIPVYTPPPTPTPTMTPTAVPGFQAAYEGTVWCTNTWWIQIALENSGPITFRSIEVTLRDIELDISVSEAADGFVERPDCSSSASRVRLQPDQILVVSSPSLDNNPDGHRMRATIMLCSKADQEGECVTNTLRFTP